jgi:type IV pilus assembly protein PilW
MEHTNRVKIVSPPKLRGTGTHENSGKGFTLVELLIAMALSGIVMGGIYSTYYGQQKCFTIQEQVAQVQQNLRGALYLMGKEIRMAGCNPMGASFNAIDTPTSTSLRVRMDITDNAGTGDPDGSVDDLNEDITYQLADVDGDSDNDLARTVGGVNQLVAENIDALDFVYLDASGTSTMVVGDIRSVQISMVARASRLEPGLTNNTAYSNQQGATFYTAPGDNFRRRFVTTQIKCRNLGLE